MGPSIKERLAKNTTQNSDKMIKYLLFLPCIVLTNLLIAQTDIVTGQVTSETRCESFSGKTFMTYKIYQSPDKKDVRKNKKSGMMTYMDLPLEAKNVSVSGDLFVSKLICFEENEVKWTKTLGKSGMSTATAITLDLDGVIYTGDKQEQSKSINLYKFDQNGNELWHTTFDSLETVHELYVDNNQNLTALVSFTYTEKVQKGQSYSYQDKFIYHTLKLDKNTGQRISKIANQGPSYFCNAGYSKPTLHNHDVNYFFKDDTLIYSRNDTLMMLNLSQDELKGHEVISTISSDLEYFVVYKNQNTAQFKLLINRWEENELKKEIDLNIAPDASILKIVKNEIGGVSIIYKLNNLVSIIKTDRNLGIKSTKACFKHFNDSVISEVSVDERGLVSLVCVKQDKQTRKIFLIKEVE